MAPPENPPYRITFFYGPESADGEAARLTCVFNVKKRSWKAGTQIAVELYASQVSRLREALAFDAWVMAVLESLPEEDRPDYGVRADDLLVQEMCALKLSLALLADVRPETLTIQADLYIDELDRAVIHGADRIKSKILADLDLATA